MGAVLDEGVETGKEGGGLGGGLVHLPVGCDQEFAHLLLVFHLRGVLGRDRFVR